MQHPVQAIRVLRDLTASAALRLSRRTMSSILFCSAEVSCGTGERHNGAEPTERNARGAKPVPLSKIAQDRPTRKCMFIRGAGKAQLLHIIVRRSIRSPRVLMFSNTFGKLQ